MVARSATLRLAADTDAFPLFPLRLGSSFHYLANDFMARDQGPRAVVAFDGVYVALRWSAIALGSFDTHSAQATRVHLDNDVIIFKVSRGVRVRLELEALALLGRLECGVSGELRWDGRHLAWA